MRRIVVLAVKAEVPRPMGMSEWRIETLPWPEWVSSFGLVAICATARREKKALYYVSLRRPADTNLTPLAAVVASGSAGVTAVCIVGDKSCETEVGSPAEVMMFPRGAIRLAAEDSPAVKESSKVRAALCASLTNLAQGLVTVCWEGSKSEAATARFVSPPIVHP